MNPSHFEALLSYLPVDDIVNIFTHMLFEHKTLLISPKVEHLVPISFALHSLIYPFQMCLFIPCIVNDGEDKDYNSLNLVSNPMNYFMGICRTDKDDVERILLEDEFTPPLMIDITPKQRKAVPVDFSLTISPG